MNIEKLENETQFEYGLIYMIRNDINGKIYFGQTTIAFKRRYSSGIENTHNKHLSNSIKKYGIENFTIIEEFDKAHSLKELNKLEEMYIKMWNTTDRKCGYNKKHGGDNKKYTEESKRKISDSLKELYKTKESARNKKVICLTTGEVFKSIVEAQKQTNIKDINLSTIEKPIASGKKEGVYLEWYDYDYYIEHKDKLIIGSNLKDHSRCGENNPMYGVSPKERMDEASYKQWKSKVSSNKNGKNNPNAKGKIMAKSMKECKVIIFQNSSQCKTLGFDHSTVRKCVRGILKHHKNYTWEEVK